MRDDASGIFRSREIKAMSSNARPEPVESSTNRTVKFVVTGPGVYSRRWPKSVLRKAVPEAHILRSGFPSVFILEAEGDLTHLAQTINRKCSENIGHTTAVLYEVESRLDPVKEAVVRAGIEQIGKDEKFCFRLHKRGSHFLEQNSCDLEREIGGAVWQALEQKYGKRPAVDLKKPDVTLVGEVLGPKTAIGFCRKDWAEKKSDVSGKAAG
jgi:tRNA(Ser,Leu) C12 N-acetylase TAN1